MGDYREGSFVGNTWLRQEGLELEKDFEAGYWVYTVAAQYIGLLPRQHVDVPRDKYAGI